MLQGKDGKKIKIEYSVPTFMIHSSYFDLEKYVRKEIHRELIREYLEHYTNDDYIFGPVKFLKKGGILGRTVFVGIAPIKKVL